MPEILSMIQVNKMTPAPAVLVVVSVAFFFINRGYYYKFYGRIYEKKLYNESYYFQAFLSLVYLCSSDIYALINYTGFATWVNFFEGFLVLTVCFMCSHSFFLTFSRDFFCHFITRINSV